MVNKTLNGEGLRGQTVGKTALSTVGKDGVGLTYRGYSIEELAQYAGFEEVAWLLLNGELPTQSELALYKKQLKEMRYIPESVRTCLELIPAETHPMEVLRSACSLLGNAEPEENFSQQRYIADRLLAVMPSLLLYWYKYSHEGIRVDVNTGEVSIAGHCLHLLYGERPKKKYERCLDVSLILYAEHELNASTFTARVCAATLSDMYSCITGAIGSLRGPLHGGANEAAMEMIEEYSTSEEAERITREKLSRKEKIMGFGHAIYRSSDPRNAIIKKWAHDLAIMSDDMHFYDIAVAIENVMWEDKKLFANADFFHAPAYRAMCIPTKLFTPLFVCARLAGWTSHVMEQRSNNRLIRPSAEYIGLEQRAWKHLADR